MKIIQIAWRNVWRNKLRSLVVIIAITLGLWGGIFSYAFMQGMGDQQIYSAIHTETGHIQVNKPNFLQNHDLKINIEDAEKTEHIIKNIPGVKGVSSSIQLTAIASTANSSAGVMINGIAPEQYTTISQLKDYLTEGTFFKEDVYNPILIGEQLADKLHAKLNSRLVFTLQTYNGDISYFAFKVAGIYKLHNSEFNETQVFVRRKDLAKAIAFPADHVSAINVLLDNNDLTQKVTTEIQQKLPGMQVQNWKKLSPMIMLMSGTLNQMSLIFVFIILLALAFGIINTMLMAVLDRTREIGMLLSIGMNQKKVFSMIVFETLFLSFTGVVIGVVISMVSISYFGTSGIDLSVISAGINALGFSSHIYPKLDAGFYPKFSLMVILIALFSSVFPARRAIKLKPAEAVRGE